MSDPTANGNDDVASPCIGTCSLDPSDLCVGCFRSRMEIARWSGASAAEKQAIVQQSVQRRQARDQSAQ
ncbi:DUF1289 domain-containing protein [Novipirellula sp. SH528]|uniref:DUF1289 domain-containing protein n=1 Tax=Novipirellula sp. SH528 TaxID=3454466 RepID=UPI003F9FD581